MAASAPQYIFEAGEKLSLPMYHVPLVDAPDGFEIEIVRWPAQGWRPVDEGTGDDLPPGKVIAFWCDGSRGLHIHPNVWHEGIFPVEDSQRFLDRQGRVHARGSCDIGAEFGVYLSVPLKL